MKTISVLFQFTFVLFGCGVQTKSLVEGMKNEREAQQEEIPSQDLLFDNGRMALGDGNGYSKLGPMYDYRAELMKRSLANHNPRQRQTGIIYGGGRPIGILQPYQESFKFMPIKEEHAYSSYGGRSSIDQPDPFMNMMYPLSRFTRSEDAIRMAEAEAAKAEFLDKHYPSMLVDFKIHNKLHPSGINSQSPPIYNTKREENSHNANNDIKKDKRENQTPTPTVQKLHKRDSQHIEKQDGQHIQKRESTPVKQPEQTVTVQKTVQKREEKKVFKREEKVTAAPEKRSVSPAPTTDLKNTKKKRQLTDSQFNTLKKTLEKRNSNGHIQVIEEDLKGLLSDMGLIEDDLQENAEEMEKRKRQVQDEDLEEGFDASMQKAKQNPEVKERREEKIVEKREEKKVEKREDKKEEKIEEKREAKKEEKREEKKEEKREEKKEEKREEKVEEKREDKKEEKKEQKREDKVEDKVEEKKEEKREEIKVPKVVEKREEKKEETKEPKVVEKREEKKVEKREDVPVEKKEDKRDVKEEEKRETKIEVKREEKKEEKKEEKRESPLISETKKREVEINNAPTMIPLIETRNAESKKRTLNDVPDKRSIPEAQDNAKSRVIEVSFSTSDNKEASAGGVNEGDNCPKPSVIPNKREVPTAPIQSKEEVHIASDQKVEIKRSNDVSDATTETYEEYEQRVAREIKNKIRLLKEEVKRELGALESDKDEEDDDDTFAESQRRKRFIVNTLLDEESENIDPNENLESSELEPHVRRRRFLSTDMMAYSPQSSYEKSNLPDVSPVNYDPMSVVENKFDFDINSFNGEADVRRLAFGNSGADAKSRINKKDITYSGARKRNAINYNTHMSDNTRIRRYRWDQPSMYLPAQAPMYLPEYQRRMSKDRYAGSGSKRTSRDDVGSESLSSDYENEAANGNSEEEAESNANQAEMTRKTAERKSEVAQPAAAHEEHAPKKIQGYNQNQKYFYYYMGGNENEKGENVASANSKNQRESPTYNNYQNQRQNSAQHGNQYYSPMNRRQNQQPANQQPAANESPNRRSFQRKVDKPHSRRRKRHTNLMVPQMNVEEAVISNVPHRNSSRPYHPKHFVRRRNRKNPKFPFRVKPNRDTMKKNLTTAMGSKNMTINGTWSNSNETCVQPTTEKGKINSTSPNSPSEENVLVPWDHQTERPVNVEQIAESSPRNTYEYLNALENRRRIWNDYLNSFSNINYNRYSQLVKKPMNDVQKPETVKENQEDKKDSEQQKNNGRKILSWQENGKYQKIYQERPNAIPYSNVAPNRYIKRGNFQPVIKNKNFINEINDFQGEVEGDEYDESYYAEPLSSSTLKIVAESTQTTSTSTTSKPTTHSTAASPKTVVTRKLTTKGTTERAQTTTQKVIAAPSTEKFHFVNFVPNRNNLFVKNMSVEFEDRKRRKRDIQPENQEYARSKRSWFWPTLSFLHNNAPEVDETLENSEFDQNESSNQGHSKRSSGKSSFSFEDEGEGDREGDFDDFGDDPIGYERKKRDTGAAPIYAGNKSPYYYYTNRGMGSSYLPVSRNRRYVQGMYREPQQQLLTEITDSELFGALPQGYAGELTRYKRVKRADKGADKT